MSTKPKGTHIIFQELLEFWSEVVEETIADYLLELVTQDVPTFGSKKSKSSMGKLLYGDNDAGS